MVMAAQQIIDINQIFIENSFVQFSKKRDRMKNIYLTLLLFTQFSWAADTHNRIEDLPQKEMVTTHLPTKKRN